MLSDHLSLYHLTLSIPLSRALIENKALPHLLQGCPAELLQPHVDRPSCCVPTKCVRRIWEGQGVCVCVCDPSGVTRFLFTFFAVLLAGGSWTHGLELLAPSPFEDLEAP